MIVAEWFSECHKNGCSSGITGNQPWKKNGDFVGVRVKLI